MLKRIRYSDVTYEKTLNKYIKKSKLYLKQKSELVSKILDDISKYGNKALIKYIDKYENTKVTEEKKLSVSLGDIKKASTYCSKDFLKASNLRRLAFNPSISIAPKMISMIVFIPIMIFFKK